MEELNEIILYQPDETVKLEVRIENETVWLTQAQLVELFQSSKANISEHIKHIYEQKELTEAATVRKFRTVQSEGGRQIMRNRTYYNLDVIISVGYRVNTRRGIEFRQWANKILKEYLLKGYSFNTRMERLEQRVSKTEEQIAFFIHTALPPVEGIFFDGQIFDAYVFASNLIKSARHSIVLIDNYVDESVLTLLDKRKGGVTAAIYTGRMNKELRLDLERHNTQYAPIDVHICTKVHDRFLLIDDEVYHIGASLKDLGKKLFAFSKMHLTSTELLQKTTENI